MEDEPRLISRRDMLKLAAAAGASLLLPFGCATPSTRPPKFIDLHSFDFPPEWHSHLGPSLNQYAFFLRSLGLKNIRVRDVIEAHVKTRGSVRNTLPPRQVWANIRPTLRVINLLAERLGTLPQYTSVYRSPEYNRLCSSARDSYHMKNNAIDFKFPNTPPGKVVAILKEMRSARMFSGGIGSYSTFTHVDTRGTNVDWSGYSGRSRRATRRGATRPSARPSAVTRPGSAANRQR